MIGTGIRLSHSYYNYAVTINSIFNYNYTVTINSIFNYNYTVTINSIFNYNYTVTINSIFDDVGEYVFDPKKAVPPIVDSVKLFDKSALQDEVCQYVM